MLRLAFVVFFFCLVLQRNAQRIYYSKFRFHVLGEVMILFFFISHSVYINQDSVMISDNVRAILPKILT